MNDFRDWLRLELAKRNLSQKELAGLLDVTQGIISRYLRGKDMPSAITLVKIAKAFNLPEKDVLAIGGYDENYRKISIAEADHHFREQIGVYSELWRYSTVWGESNRAGQKS